jgi:sterol desaturase/sphingolipid hydroxylase (fatty acid hydroxylase superfamily)
MEALASLLNLKGILLAALILVPLERLVPNRRGQKILRRGWINDAFGYALLNGLVIKVGLMALALAGVLLGQQLPAALRDAVASQSHWLQAIELLIVGDLLFYGVHRAFHAVPALWRFHAIHHSIEEMDWLAGHRVHPLDQILTKGIALVPCFALGFSAWAIAAFVIFYQCHSLLLHSNIRCSLGPLRWLLASPQFHHWHHSSEREGWNRNFGAQLPWWDMLFATAHMPKGRSTTSFGIPDPVPSKYWQQLLYPFRSRDAVAAPITVARPLTIPDSAAFPGSG